MKCVAHLPRGCQSGPKCTAAQEPLSPGHQMMLSMAQIHMIATVVRQSDVSDTLRSRENAANSSNAPSATSPAGAGEDEGTRHRGSRLRAQARSRASHCEDAGFEIRLRG